MPNRLADSTSPYLLQHADNPVDWWEWGDDAFADARERDVPVFLSVGYSSCHWCHVMAHESFEDDEVAAYLNEHFVAVKVDREERPDVDSVYMTVTQALTGHGGWPMSVFLDHDGRAFHAGTYWPRRRRGGMPAFPEVLAAVVDGWRERRGAVAESAARIAEHVRERTAALAVEEGADAFDADALTREAATAIVATWDRRLGGFGRAPKFPQAMAISFLLDHHVRTGHEEALAAAVHSLRAMVRGGIHDQLTGGFARYSTDERWLVPHFEKMLYDNGLLLAALADAAALTGDEVVTEGAHRTAAAIPDWFEHDSDAFIAATDADSEGEEGRYFVFTHAEAAAAIAGRGLDPERWLRFLGVRGSGNWEGTNVLHEAVDRDVFRRGEGLDEPQFLDELNRARTALAHARDARVRPGADDKLIAAWNALAIRGLLTAADRLGEPRHRAVAGLALDAVEQHLVDEDGRLHRSARAGRRGATGFLDDVALVADASLLYAERTGDLDRLDLAVGLVDHALTAFAAADGGLFTTPDDGDDLWLRPRDDADNAVPAGTSVLAGVLLRLAALTGDDDRRRSAERLLAGFLAPARRWPVGFGEALRGAERLAAAPVEVAVVGPPGDDRDALLAAAVATPVPGLVTFVAATGDDGLVDPAAAARVPLLEGRRAIDGRPTAYVCRAMTCRLPVTAAAAVRDELAALAGPGPGLQRSAAAP